MQRWGNIPGIYWIFVTRPNVGLDEQDEKQQGVTPEGSKRKHETYTSSPKFNIPFVICPIFPRFLLEITPEACFEHRFFIILFCRYASLTLGDVTFQPCLSRPTVRSGVNLKRHSQEDKKTGNSFVHLKCREETLDALCRVNIRVFCVFGFIRRKTNICARPSWGVCRWRDASILHEWSLKASGTTWTAFISCQPL